MPYNDLYPLMLCGLAFIIVPIAYAIGRWFGGRAGDTYAQALRDASRDTEDRRHE